MADIKKVLQELPNISEMLYQIYKDETDKESISIRYDQYLAVDDAIELLKEQQAEIDRLKAEKNRVIEQIESEIHRVLRECGGVKDDVGKAQYQWLINGYQSALDMIKDGE